MFNLYNTILHLSIYIYALLFLLINHTANCKGIIIARYIKGNILNLYRQELRND